MSESPPQLPTRLPALLPDDDLRPSHFPTLTLEWLEKIIQEYEGGRSLAAVSRLPGYPPYQVLMSWLAKSIVFKERLKTSAEVRAMAHADRAVEMCEELEQAFDPGGRDRAAVAKAVMEARMGFAAVEDPVRFAKKGAIPGGEGAVHINIITGVPAPAPHQEPPALGPDGRVLIPKPDIEVKRAD